MNSYVRLTAGYILCIAALIHLIRVFYPFTVIIGEFTIPVYVSAIFFPILGSIGACLFQAPFYPRYYDPKEFPPSKDTRDPYSPS